MILSRSFFVSLAFFWILLLGASNAFVPQKSSSLSPWGVAQRDSRLHAVAEEDNDAFRLLGEDQLKRTAKQQPKMAVAPKPAARKSVGDALKIIIAGAPASGKGTQCEIIKEKYGVVHLSTGDMLRAAVVDQTDVGKLAKEYMDSGKLVPDEVIIKVVSKSRMRVDGVKTPAT